MMRPVIPQALMCARAAALRRRFANMRENGVRSAVAEVTQVI
jgi:hypothetical protein